MKKKILQRLVFLPWADFSLGRKKNLRQDFLVDLRWYMGYGQTRIFFYVS